MFSKVHEMTEERHRRGLDLKRAAVEIGIEFMTLWNGEHSLKEPTPEQDHIIEIWLADSRRKPACHCSEAIEAEAWAENEHRDFADYGYSEW